MVFLFTGNGKGKTTAAIGQAVRALGQGKKAIMYQFIKSPSWPSGEEKTVRKFGKKFQIIKGGMGFVGILGDKLSFKVHKKAAEKTLAKAEKTIKSLLFDLVILDEINVAVSLGLIAKKRTIALALKFPKDKVLILTGRNASRELIETADLVTNFEEIRHPFQKKIPAQKGIEY